MEQETQGKTTSPMDNQQQNTQKTNKILSPMTGALSVLSYPSMLVFNLNSTSAADFKLMLPAKNLSSTPLSSSGGCGGTRARSK